MNLDALKLRCDKILEAMVGIPAAAKWWNSPNKAFGMDTPKKRWNESPEEVYTYLLNYIQR